jgi:hypothetical protein
VPYLDRLQTVVPQFRFVVVCREPYIPLQFHDDYMRQAALLGARPHYRISGIQS